MHWRGFAKFAVFICLFSIALLKADSPDISAGSAKSPLPDPAALRVASKNIKEIYGKRLAQARDQAGKLAICDEVIKTANDESDPANRFAMLILARDTAAGAGALAVSYRAIDAMDATFRIDGLRMKADAAATASRMIGSTADARAFANASLSVIEQVVAADRYEFVRELGNETVAAARKAGGPVLLQQATAEVQRANEAAKDFADLQRALLTLTQNPDDPDANLKVGKFRCLVHGDWDHGLPMLARGNEPALSRIARDELAQPTDREQQLNLGDAWWALAAAGNGDSKVSYEVRAAKWYGMALPQMTGLRQLSIEKRLKEIQAARQATDPRAGVELLRTMKGINARFENGVVILKDPARIESSESFQPPVEFRVVVQTDSTNIRIAYACDEMIFNWEENPDEFRIGGGPANFRHQPGAGRVPVKQWVTIDIKVLPDSLTVDVDGKPRYQTNADFSKISMPFAIFPSHGSTVEVQSILTRRPAVQ